MSFHIPLLKELIRDEKAGVSINISPLTGRGEIMEVSGAIHISSLTGRRKQSLSAH